MSVRATGLLMGSPHTFTHPLLCADLLAIFHSMQCKIYLGYRLFVLNGAGGDVEVVPRCVDVHLVELREDEGVRFVEGTRLGQRWGWPNATANGA